MQPDVDLTFTYANEVASKIRVIYRPYLIATLEYLAKDFNLIVYTAGSLPYAEPILNDLDPEGLYFAAKLYRHNCISVDRYHLKDLSLITEPLGMDNSRILLIDNSLISFTLNLSNGIPIPDFFGEAEQKEDKELIFAAQYVSEIFKENEGDIRERLQNDFRIPQMLAKFREQK